MFNLNFKIYNYQDYINVIKKYECKYTYYPDKPTVTGNKFYSDLLTLSNNRCYMCGQSLETNSKIKLCFEREHLINKKIDEKANDALLKCKKNLVPICRTCNSQKITVNMSDLLKIELDKLNTNCNTSMTNCAFDDCMNSFKLENFDYNITSNFYTGSDNEVKFNFMLKTFYGDSDYINQFDLNSRSDNLFLDIIKIIYNTNFSGYFDLPNHIKMFSKNTLDDEFINKISDNNLLKNNDCTKLNSLIETMTLLNEL